MRDFIAWLQHSSLCNDRPLKAQLRSAVIRQTDFMPGHRRAVSKERGRVSSVWHSCYYCCFWNLMYFCSRRKLKNMERKISLVII